MEGKSDETIVHRPSFPRARANMSEITERLSTAIADRYKIERELGQGGMATVYLAHDVKHDRKVAVKVLRPDLAASLGSERFLREVRIAANLQHPHVLPLYDSGEADGFLFYVMPYVEGESLRAKLEREGELPVADAVRILKEVVDALAYAHEHGVVHRDIKPDNVMLSGRHALVTDFGIAKAVSEATGRQELTTAGVALGTPAYMAPEQAAADPHVDHRADIYAVGALGYELLTGRPPFVGSTPQQVLSAHVMTVPDPVTAHRAAVPVALADVVMRCLEKKPADRWQSADAVLSALESGATPSLGITPTDTRPISAVGVRFDQRKVLVPAVGLVLAIGAIGVVGVVLRDRAPDVPVPEVSSSIVAVFPFAVRGGDTFQYLGEGMVNLLSTSLNGAGALRTVDPRALLGRVSRSGGRPSDPREAADIAREFGAGLYVLGDILDVGGTLRIDGALYSLERGTEAVAQGTAQGAAASISELIDELAAQLITGQRLGPGGRLTRLASVTTASLDALKAYLEGEIDFRQGRDNRGVEGFQRAVALDSTFALAYYRMSVAAAWAGRADLATSAVQSAQRYRNRLSERDARLVDALQAFLRGNATAAEGLYLASVSTYPDDVEAWYMLGETRRHFAPLHGGSILDSRDPFEQVLRYEPEHVSSLFHLAEVAAKEGAREELDSLVGRFLELFPSAGVGTNMRIMGAFSLGDEELRSQLLARFADSALSETPIREVASYLRNPKGGLALARLNAASTKPQALRIRSARDLANLYLGRGQWERALDALAEIRTLASDSQLVYAAWLSLFPLLSTSERVLDSLWAALRGVGSLPGVQYVRGLLSVRRGDRVAALQIAERLERIGSDSFQGRLAGDFSLIIQAEVARHAGDAARALALLEQTIVEVPYGSGGAIGFATQPYHRYSRAGLLAEAGRATEALRWYASIGDISLEEFPYIAPSHIRRAEIFEQQGEREKAVEEYAAFLHLWQDADPQFEQLVIDVRERVARLQAGGRR